MSLISSAHSTLDCLARAGRFFRLSAPPFRYSASCLGWLFASAGGLCAGWFCAPELGLNAVAAASDPVSQATQLEPGKLVERELKGGELHSYELQLAAGQFVEVAAEQLGGNLRLILLKPAGAVLVEADTQRGLRGVERAYLLAETAGRYGLRVKSMRPHAVPGAYRLQVTEPRLATSQDHDRISAQAQQYDIGELARRKTDVASWQQGVTAYQAALSVWRALGEPQREADVLSKLSEVYWLLLRAPEAAKYATQARTLYRALNDPNGEANALFALGQAYRLQRERALLIEHYEQALRLYRQLGERFGAGLALYWLSPYYKARGEKQRALTCAEEAVQIMRAAGELGHEGAALVKLGDIYDSLGNRTKALAAFEQARVLFQIEGQPVLVAGAFNDSGEVYAAQGEIAQAQAAYRSALAIFREIGDRHVEAQPGAGRALLASGKLANLQGNKEQAFDYYQQALAAYQLRDGYHGQTDVRRHFSAAYRALGEWQKALDQSYKVWLIYRDGGDREAEASALAELAFIHLELGDGQQALALYEQALALYRALGDREAEAHKLTDTGIAYNLLGEKQRAIERLQQAVRLCQAINSHPREAFALSVIAAVYEAVGKRQLAQQAYARSLMLSRAVEDRHLEGTLLLALGNYYSAFADQRQALKYQTQAVALYRRMGNRIGEANALSGLGKTSALLGQLERGMELHRQAIQLTRAAREPREEARAFFRLARTQRRAGRLTAARSSLEAALQLIETIRTNVVSQDLRASYFAATQDYFADYTDLLMELHQQDTSQSYDAAAFQASERRRARSLLELLAEARADLRGEAVAELLASERNLQQQFSAKTEQLRALRAQQPAAAQLATLDGQLKRLWLDLQQIKDQLRAANPRYAALTQPLNLAEIQQQVLDPDTLLLEYALGQERSYLWAVTPTTIDSFVLPGRAKIEAQARQVFSLLTARAMKGKNETPEQRQARIFAADRQFPTAAATLSWMLLSPVATQLGHKRLLIVADGALQYLPFAALPIPERGKRGKGEGMKRGRLSSPSFTPLLVQHEIVNLPSASTLAVLRRELAGRARAPKMAAVLADPVFTKADARLSPAPAPMSPMSAAASATNPLVRALAQRELLRAATESGVVADESEFNRLEASRKEAQALAALLPPAQLRLALDFAANRATALSAKLSQYQIIHFATHGLLNSRHPELSGLVFSLVNEQGADQDGFLRLHEIYGLKLPAELVTLSACQTALGKEINGEGLVGLTRGFMYAGAARVLATLWQVDDEKTASLMQTFYARLLAPNGAWRMSPAAALRAAQLEMWKQTANRPPYYWAGFVLQGEYK